MAKINALYRYPVKGLSADSLAQMKLEKDKGIAFDRQWAIENGSQKFDPQRPKFLPKRTFFQLYLNGKLAQLRCQFDESSQTLVIIHEGEELLRVAMNSAESADMIETFFANFMEEDSRGKPRLVSADGHYFTDISQKAVSLINLASVDEISKAAGQEISPLRFRGNIYVEGFEPWAEMDWVGKTVSIDGQPLFEVFAITGRCPATQVNLETGERDVSMLGVLSDNFGHTKCGVYMRVINNGLIRPGGNITVS